MFVNILCGANFQTTFVEKRIAYKRDFSTFKDQSLSVNRNSLNSSDQSLYNLITGKSELRGSTFSDLEFIEWFRGISDGEASFHINLKQKDGSVVSAEFRYSIQLHKDDEPWLLYIKNRLGFGTVKIFGNAVQFNVGAK